MKIVHLINDTYQVVDDKHTYVQGTYDDCLRYMMDRLMDKIKSTPELLDVFKRLADK